MRWNLFAVAVLGLACLNSAARADDDVVVVEQNCVLTPPAEAGAKPVNLHQKVYLHNDFMCIDEYAGAKAGDSAPLKSTLIDFKNKQIVGLDHELKKKSTESFETRNKALDELKAQITGEIAKQPAGPQRELAARTYRAMFDENCAFQVFKDSAPNKTLLGVSCRVVQAVDAKAPEYMPLEMSMHPSIESPCDNTEAFYLLGLTGKMMSRYMASHHKTFKSVPLEIHLDLPTGGKLEVQAISAEKLSRKEVDAATSRGSLGSPFTIPAYEESKH